ncbi:site-2 protease family protein [Fervidobacterium sp. 2310opik-2]|uniref:site-2 protease family protein n=1 Tax=Fervidobacterium sp. 2310opik-2 TaxID=1755815 RepID=UPI0013DF6B93|nr:site-2 protease family protein [Fervidobacterium sp. 2310opik-2]KAF2962336.1 peptidase M50 [Fervidobacterium sp. 2310opik-2]
MSALLISVIKNIIIGLIAYLLISLPREWLRNFFMKLINIRTDDKVVFLKKNGLFKYVDPIGLLTFIFFDFGWIHQPAIDYSKTKGKKLFIYSIFGIISSFILFFLYAYLCRVLNNALLFNLFYTSAKWSLTLAIISLFPIPPLDGSRIILSFLPSKYYEWYLKFSFYGIIFMIGLLVLWILPMIMQPLSLFITNVTNFITFRN